MSWSEIIYCPGNPVSRTLFYSSTCRNRVFSGRKVHHILPYVSPASDEATAALFDENRKRISISGVQEKFSVLQEKNKIRLINEGEQGTDILKPIPGAGKNPDQMPANEHLTMQIARQVFDIETAENALIFLRMDLLLTLPGNSMLKKMVEVGQGGLCLPGRNTPEPWRTL